MRTHRYLLRAVIEFTTPFLIASGRGERIADAEFVADANGLPMIPGSSIAGVLRSMMQDEEEAEKIFGYQRGNDGSGSLLSVSCGFIHNSSDKPTDGIVPSEALCDEVLTTAMTPVLRDHVRINHKGAADNRGKFDEYAVCAGQRFTFELEIAGGKEDSRLWDKVIKLITTNPLKFGGRTRQGYGACKLISLRERTFDLSDTKDFEDYLKYPVKLSGKEDILKESALPASEGLHNMTIIHLEAENYWMFGGGEDLLSEPRPVDMAPVRDNLIVWEKGENGTEGKVKRNVIVIPGSSVKGAIAHRTAFHYNVLKGNFADKVENLEEFCGENNGAVRDLFGFAGAGPQDGARGKISIDDVFIENDPPSNRIAHVTIDRFTGGAKDTGLFDEKPLYKGGFDIKITMEDPDSIDDESLKAFNLALDDLRCGRLQLGAGSGRGMGYFKDKVEEVPVRIKEAVTDGNKR